MMEDFFLYLINMIIRILTLLVIAKVIISYFMSPYHPVRETIDRIVEPMLAPIRKFVPPVGMLDFTPFIFIVILYILGAILTGLFSAIF
jgi:YggT family protein